MHTDVPRKNNSKDNNDSIYIEHFRTPKDTYLTLQEPRVQNMQTYAKPKQFVRVRQMFLQLIR